MAKRKAFWGDKGGQTKPISGLVNDLMLDFRIDKFGVQFRQRSTGNYMRFITWIELHRISQLPVPINAAEMANALHGELREPRIVEDDGA